MFIQAYSHIISSKYEANLWLVGQTESMTRATCLACCLLQRRIKDHRIAADHYTCFGEGTGKTRSRQSEFLCENHEEDIFWF